MAFWCLLDRHCCNGGGEESRPITRSNYPPSAAFLAAVVKALAKTLLHQYRDPKSPKSQREGSASPRSRRLPNTKTWAPEVNSLSFKGTLLLSSSRPSNWMEERRWCQPLGMAPEDDTAGISTLTLVPHHHTPGSQKASGRPVCACSESA